MVTAALIALLVSCGGDPAAPSQVQERTIGLRIEPSTIYFDALGDTMTLKAIRLTSLGGSFPEPVPVWINLNPSVAEIGGEGRVRSVGNGVAQFKVSADGFSAEAFAVVDQKPDSILLTPRSTSVVEGNVISFGARVLDRLGNDLATPPTLAWGSLAPHIASIEGPGRVRAVTPDTAEITAVSGEAWGTATVRVAPQGWPNEPEGFTPVTDQTWDALGSNGWGHVNRQSKSLVVPDSTAPMSPLSVLEHQYPAGYQGGSEPAADFFGLQGKSEVFVGFWLKISEGWHGHPTGTNKIIFLFNADTNTNLFMAMRPTEGAGPDGPFELVMYPQGHLEQSLREGNGIPAWFLPNRKRRTVDPARWYRVEVQFSQAEGTLRWWQDGELVAEHVGLALDGSAGFGELQIAPTWGGGGGAKRQNDYLRFDHIYVSVGSR